jgi:hypothetical protein
MELTVSQTHKTLLNLTPESYEIIIKGLDDLDAGLITDAQMDDIVYDLYFKVFHSDK